MTATSIVQLLPYAVENPNAGRFIVLEDYKTGEKVEVPFEKNALTAIYKNRMFDIYGRELEIDPSIVTIIERVGRYSFYNTDVETYLVENEDGEKRIAHVNYYYESETGDFREDCVRYVSDFNPLFSSNTVLKAELACTNYVLVNSRPFPDESALIRHYVGDSKKLWLFRRGDLFLLIEPRGMSRKTISIFRQKSDLYEEWSGGAEFSFFSYSSEKILAIIQNESGRRQLVATDEDFLERKFEEGVSFSIPFYLVEEGPA